MKSYEWALEHIRELEKHPKVTQNLWSNTFLSIPPEDWTEEAILEEIENDIRAAGEYIFFKSDTHIAILADSVESWLTVLESDLTEKHEYLGDEEFLKKTARELGFELVISTVGDGDGEDVW